MSDSTEIELVERCLHILHGDGDYGWRLIKQQWPDVAVTEQRRVMSEVIVEVRKTDKEGLK